jgi:CHAT domain-containing protein
MPEVKAADGNRQTLGPLPGAEAEGRIVAEFLRAKLQDGSAASETAVRRVMNNAPVVHLATHAFAYSGSESARESFVALAPGDGNDGRLTVSEILSDPSIKLTAQLVVLSACQTGLGNLRQAEGTIGLQRAFLAKGANSLLVSLWSVSDAATRAMMGRFYQHWLRDSDKPSKAEALRRSEEDVRAMPGWSAPRFWAAFQLVGAS